ncbi:MAG: DinB family protein [Bryobacteraceae bacterium]
MSSSLAVLFQDSAVRRLEQNCVRIADCVSRLTEEQVWARGSAHENAIGNLMLHLAGNVRQWILSGVGGQPDIRQRDSEFAAAGGVIAAEMLERLQATVREACGVIGTLSAEQLEEKRVIQGYEVSVLEALFHVVEHFSMHTGQILFATKILTQEDLGYYRHLNKPGPHGEVTP